MNKRPFTIFFTLLLIFVVGCSQSSASYDASSAVPEVAYYEEEASYGDSDDYAPAEKVAASPSQSASGQGEIATELNNQTSNGVERLIIRTGYLSIIVKDSEQSTAIISQLATSLDGWVVNSNLNQYGNNSKRGEITIRIPADKYDQAIGAIKETAVEVTTESSNSQDVTEEFVDLSARLDNLNATADRVRLFLDQTENIEEALAVNQELSRLESEIEQIKGRMKYLSQSAAYSTINVQIFPDSSTEPISVNRWQASGVAKDAIEALVDTLRGFASILIWLIIYLLPITLLVGLPIFFLIRFAYRKWRS